MIFDADQRSQEFGSGTDEKQQFSNNFQNIQTTSQKQPCLNSNSRKYLNSIQTVTPIFFKIVSIPDLDEFMLIFFIINLEFSLNLAKAIKKALELISDGIL